MCRYADDSADSRQRKESTITLTEGKRKERTKRQWQKDRMHVQQAKYKLKISKIQRIA